ncbi:MAG: VWA domain-containing protein [Ruminococcus sp.]|nr:VWA domain-containing protein [Ruminococcus sp.]
MPKTEELGGTPRKELHVFYVLDTSGSMDGAKISALNHAMEESISALSELAKSNGDAKLKVAVMEFNSGCKWVTSNGPEDLEEDFEYEYLEAGGLTDMGAALKELNSKLNRHAFLNSMTGALMPVIIFMTDGYATDDYEKALEEIRKNRWFARGTKIGFALGDDPDVKMIASVVGNSEAVIKTTDLDLFRRLMKFVSVTASMLVSQSTTTETVTTGEGIVEQAKKDLGVPDNATVQLDDNEYNKEPEPPTTDDDWDDEDW